MRALWPNLVTSVRGLSGLVVAWCVLDGAWLTAFFVFLAAVCTDLIDGPLARWLDAITPLGALLDPLADKLLTLSTWLAVGWVGWAPAWLVGLFVLRDALVIGGWLVGRCMGRRWRSGLLGRLMLTFEGIALPILLVRSPWLDVHWPTVGLAIGGVALGFAAASGLQYAIEGPVADDGL